MDQPTHGYDIRKRLELWRAEQWANVAYGSIYHALSKMAREGLIEPVESDDEGRPARISYRITDLGEAEFQRLLREYWWERKHTIDPFQVALTFMDALPRDELLAVLRRRADLLRADLSTIEWTAKLKTTPPNTPPHIAETARLFGAHIEAELRWAEEAIGKVERGELP
jgi:DNA-binding PadR family transcriptional regulator